MQRMVGVKLEIVEYSRIYDTMELRYMILIIWEKNYEIIAMMMSGDNWSHFKYWEDMLWKYHLADLRPIHDEIYHKLYSTYIKFMDSKMFI